MKQRSKILLALLLSASVAVTPVASVPVFAEDLDIASEEIAVESEEVADVTDNSVLADDAESADLTAEEDTTTENVGTDLFNDGKVDEFSADVVSAQDATEAKTHSIKVSVTNSSGVASGMYAMDDAIVTKQDDGTYLVKMHQASENRNYMALVNGTTDEDIAAATQHKVDWYVADSSYYYTIPVASLSDTIYASFSKTANVNKGNKWGNVQTITFDTASMADTDKSDVDASGMNKQAALDYSSVDAALATVPKDLSIYTDETANAVTSAVKALNGTYKAVTQDDVDKLATAITDAVNALVKKPVEEAKTHSIKVSVTNSSGVASGMYAMDDAIVTKQDDGTYLVKMHQASENRNYMALVNGTTDEDLTAATQHKVDWYVADSSYYYTIPVASLSDTIYASFSKTANVNKGNKWGNIQTITFDTTSMADTDKSDVDASGMNKQAALDYSAVDAALATVPEDLSIYTDETANAVTSAVKALNGTYKAVTQDDVDKLATAINDAVNALVEKGLLTVTNDTAMFNVEKAVLRDGKLIVTLHGTGYHYLYKGTYEEAVANGDNRENWIAGEEVNGKWQFTIPVAEGETFLPIVAISNSYLTKYEEGKNSLERAFYPRQAVIDQDAATLVTGDYDHTKDLTVDNQVKMFNVAAASLETIGGPNSNNYKEILHLTMGTTSFDKAFIGSAEDAAKAETTTDITNSKVSFDMKVNAMGGEATTDYLEKDVVFSFHSTKNDSWYERVFNVSKANGTLTITTIPATGITLSATSQTLEAGKSFQLTTTVAPSNTTDAVVWASNNEAVATVSKDGTVTAVNAGTAVITATAGNVKAECTVTVTVPATGITLNADSQTLEAGKSFQLTATVAPSNTTDAVVWASNNEAVATVSKDGTVTAVNAGTAVITATAGNVKAECTVTVTVPATGITLNADSQTLEAGKSFQLTATATPSNTTDKVVWTSSNEAVATVSEDGTVIALTAGTAVITATAGSVSAECTITVTVPATKVTLNATTQKVAPGKSFTLKATVTPANTTDKVAWSSSNTSVARVSANGTVTAVKAGTAVITATAGNVKATCTVTVANPVYKVTGIKLAATPSRKIAAGKKVQLKATIVPSNATNKTIKWTTSNKKVATVNSKGVVTFKKNAGGKKVTITAATTDGSKKSQKITLTCMKGSVKSIKLSGKTTLKPGKTTKLKAKVTTQKGTANKSVVWSSSNTKLATVDKNGKVKAVKGKKGTVTITAKATDGSGKKATIKIKIK